MKWDTATRYQLLLRINNAIVSASTRRGVFSAIAQSLGDIFHFDRLSINLYEEKTNSLTYFAAAEGISPADISEEARPLAKGAIASAVIRSREPFILSDLSSHIYWQSVKAMKDSILTSVPETSSQLNMRAFERGYAYGREKLGSAQRKKKSVSSS